MTTFAVGAATHTGMRRDNNQDQFLVDAAMFAVADGMGGHFGGEIASAIAVDALVAEGPVETLHDLVERVQEANTQIVERGRLEPALKGMGTTVCILTDLQGAGPDRLGIANVGDSRLYRVGSGGLHQHTEDHSLVESLVRDGRLTREEADNHPQRNIVTRALGIDEQVLVDAWEVVPVVGDRYLICSDGLFGEVADAEIHQVLSDTESPQAAADDLIVRANEAGGRDNITVVIVDIVAADPVADPPDDRVSDVRKALPDERSTTVRPSGADHREATGPHRHEARTATIRAVLTWRLGVLIAAVLVVVGVLLTPVAVCLRSGYFVGTTDEGQVAIYQGREGGVLWFDPTLESESGLRLADLSPADRNDVRDARSFDSLAAAEAYVATLVALGSTDEP